MDATRAEGPWRRAAIWVAGCSIRCPGCCNPELFNPQSGQAVEPKALTHWLLQCREQHKIEGVSILGGEPLEQSEALLTWLAQIRPLGLGVIVFSGMRWSALRARPRMRRLETVVDTLIDGPFMRTRPEPSPGRAVIGSANQRLWHFSPRYQDPGLWRGPRRAQIQVGADARLRVHGSPALVAKIKTRLDAL